MSLSVIVVKYEADGHHEIASSRSPVPWAVMFLVPDRKPRLASRTNGGGFYPPPMRVICST